MERAIENKEWLLGKSVPELKEIAKEVGLKPFAASQIAMWLYKHKVRLIDDMTNLSLSARQLLKERYIIGGYDNIEELISVDGTKKYLFPTINGATIESAYIPDRDRATLCVSSQAGCRMGCRFCMTARGGFAHNLSAGEIIAQIFRIPDSDRLTNIVYMGMGEPLDNYDQVKRSLDILTSDWGMGWSPTRITLSTIGVYDSLAKFLAESKVHLAVSMHTPFASERLKLMPSEGKHNIEKTVELIKQYDFSHQRRVSFEYTMFAGLNDTPRHVEGIKKLLKGLPCRMNLIRFHQIPDSDLRPSSMARMTEFRDALSSAGITTTIRSSRGEDIFAACGMLSSKDKS